tara:strand:- start:22 stop:1404 length:1383 start_codon:yes stop_codon:yes gene_type:complete
MNKKLTIENTRGLVDPCIYMLTAPNGKIYVGSTSVGFHKRSRAYRNEKAHCLIGRALKKYGASDFVFSILESSKAWGKDKLQEREQCYIDERQPFSPSGYNLQRIAGVMTPQNKRPVNQYTKSGEFVASFESGMDAGRKTNADVTTINECCRGEVKSAGGFIWLYSDSSSPKELAESVARLARYTGTLINQYTLVGVFVEQYQSVKHASDMTHVDSRSIYGYCKGDLHSAGGFIWIHSNKATKIIIASFVARAMRNQNNRAVNQYTKTGALVDSHSSVKSASRDTSCNSSGIIACCKGKAKTAGRFLWIYTEEVTPQELARRVKQVMKPHGCSREVSQYTRAGVLIKEYESTTQAARETGAQLSRVSACCRGDASSTVGFLWLFSADATPREIARRVERVASAVISSTRRFSQYTRAGVLIKEYESTKQAASETGVHQSSVTTCCRGKQKSAGGFVWRYA